MPAAVRAAAERLGGRWGARARVGAATATRAVRESRELYGCKAVQLYDQSTVDRTTVSLLSAGHTGSQMSQPSTLRFTLERGVPRSCMGTMA